MPDSPRRYRFFKLVLVLFCLAQVWRAAQAMQEIGALPEIALSPPPIYLAVTSALWAVVFGICLLAVALRLRWAALAAILAGVLNQAHVWIDRLAFSRSTESMQTLGFAVILSAIFIAILSIPAAHFYLNTKHEL